MLDCGIKAVEEITYAKEKALTLSSATTMCPTMYFHLPPLS